MAEEQGARAGDGAESRESAVVRLRLEDGFRFSVDLGDGFAQFAMDEPVPLGAGSAPNASRVLAAAVGDCLGASLLYCLRRARVEVTGVAAEVEVVPGRNERGRLRIDKLRVHLRPDVVDGAGGRVARCLELFEDFCVVTESVRSGIDVDVDVDVGEEPSTPTGDAPVAGTGGS